MRAADAVFSGGGVKGLAFAGALQAAEDAGWGRWERVAGTSAGAICATAVALGYDAAGLRGLFSFDFGKIDDRILGFVPNYFGHAVTKGRALTAWIESVVAGAPTPARTFGDLPAGKLQVIGTDIVHQRMVILPRDADLYVNPSTGARWSPDEFPLVLAARISAGYPGFFPPIVMRDAATGRDGALVDGGVTSGFPVFLFDVPRPTRPTWGFQLYDGPPENPISGPLWPWAMIMGIINAGINSLDAFEMESFGKRVIAIPTRSVGALDFSLTEAQKTALYDSGAAAARTFFASSPDPTNRFGAVPPL